MQTYLSFRTPSESEWVRNPLGHSEHKLDSK